MLSLLLLIALAAFVLGYLFYARILEKNFGVDNTQKTPSHTEYDGVDRVPTHKAILLGHHFCGAAVT